MSDSPLPDPNAELPLEALDIQHDTDPAEEHGTVRRIPHLGHAILFFCITFTALNVVTSVCFVSLKIPLESMTSHPGVVLFAEAMGYFVSLAFSFWLFPRIWRRSFLQGIQWNVLAAHRRWFWIVPSAIALSATAQFSERFVRMPADNGIAKLMQTSHGAWLVTLFGVLLAPIMEEIAFRGFLLPALATAYDWLALERTPAGLRKWEMTSTHSTASVVFGAVFASIPFALLHAGQLSGARGALGILFIVSLALSYVRVRTHSVACSTLMHMTYNLTIFALVFFSTGGYRHLEKL